MAILIGCEDGLYEYGTALHRLECPLSCVTAMACGEGIAVLDGRERLLWDGRQLMETDPGVEAALWWRGNILTLSSETDSLTLLDGQTGQPVMLAPAGVYPQHMCHAAQAGTVAVCGGADGCIRVMALPSLSTIAQCHVPGSASRITLQGGSLYALCTVENGDLQCLLCRIPSKGNRSEPLLTLPGLPGAIAGDGQRGLWIAAGEALYHVIPGAKAPDAVFGGFGLISQLAATRQGLLVCDPVLDICCLLDRGARSVIRKGRVQCACAW